MNKKRSIIGILGISIISIIIMYVTEFVINAAYMKKSIIKIILFLIIPLLYSLCDKNIGIRDNFKIKSKKGLFLPLILGAFVYLFILVSYIVLKAFINSSNIIEMLDKNAGVSKESFLVVAIYISFINSLLEEFFFRGFMFLNLKKLNGRKFAYVISALVFSLYHIAIMGTWFNPIIFLIAMLGLFIGGIIFNFLNEKSNNIYSSWIVHMMANLSINTVGLMMYGLI